MPELKLILKTLLFTIVAPGGVSVLLPYLLLHSRLPRFHLELGAGRLLGLLPLAAGIGIYLWCVWEFMAARGTPAPIDAPKELVTRGLYRYVRNPMYLGILLIILGEAMLFETGLLLAYGVLLFLVVHTFVVLYEEPTLARLFGTSYERYRRRVGRWLPRVSSLAGER